MPLQVTCNGTIIFRYRYTACDNVTTVDWTKTYNVIYSGGLLPPPNDMMTVSCPADAVNPGPPTPITDACGRLVFPLFVGVESMPLPVTCNGTIIFRYRYTACDNVTTADWTKTYTVTYSGGLLPPPNSMMTVSCPADALNPGPPAPIMDACGRLVFPLFVGVESMPLPVTCNGTIVFRYRYTACDNVTTVDWTKTYTVTYSGGLIPPPNDMMTVSCPADAVNPGPPAPIMDACGRAVNPVFVGVEQTPDPVTCNGTIVWRYRYTACDNVTTVDWIKTYTVIYSGGLLPPPNDMMTVSCPDAAVNPGPPAPIMDACGRAVNPVFVGVEQTPDPVTCNGTIVWRYRYTACDNVTTVDWIKTYTVIYSGGLLPPPNDMMTVSCPDAAVNPGPPAPIMDACGRTVNPVLVGMEQMPDPVTCNGTIVWRYRYTACDNVTTVDWTKTYTVVRNDFTVPMNDGVVVPFAILANPNLVPLPTVLSDCGEPLTPSGGPFENYFANDTYNGCEGTITFTWIYTDCAGHAHIWTFTFTVVRPDFVV